MPAMQNLSHDLMFLVGDLYERKIPRVLGELSMIQGQKGVPPRLNENERQAIRFIKGMHRRMSIGNYRITDTELGTLRDVTSWAMAKMHEIKKLKAVRAGTIHAEKEPILNWYGNTPPHEMLAPGTYSAVLVAIHDGTLDEAVNQA